MNELMLQQYIDTMSTSMLYQRNQAAWEFLLYSYMGGEEYKNAAYLTRYVNETDKEYSNRLNTTFVENHCKSVIQTYISFLFREEPDRDLGLLEYDSTVRAFLEDADLDGRSFNAFMKEVSIWASVFGHCWIIMAKPNVNAATLGDELAMGVRPYVNVLTPLTVMDWTWTRDPLGRFELSYLKYTEEVNDSFTTIKEWSKTSITTTVVNHEEKSVESSYTEENQLGKIPAIIAYNQRSPARGIGISDIADIAMAQKFLYNLTSEVEQSIRINGHPALVKTVGTEASAGAGAIVTMEDNLDSGLKPYMLSVSTDTNQIYQAIGHTIESIDKMANTGSIRSTEARRLSGVAQEQEFQLLNAKLSEKADNLELVEEQVWELWCQYQGKTWEGTIEYADSFNIKDNMGEVQKLVAAKSAATDPRVLNVIDHELLEALDEDPEAVLGIAKGEYLPAEQISAMKPFEPHLMVNPETGDKYYARTMEEHLAYADLGYVHEQESY